MSQRLWLPALLAAMVLWFLPLGSYRLFDPDEGRYAEIPREMVASGDWVTPRLNDLRYFEKPPLQYWATAATFEIFGQHEWTARLWVAMSGFLGLLMTAWIGTRLFGPLTGALAALVQGGALLYLGLARISTLDMGLTATLELALVGLLLLVQRGRGAQGTRLGAALLALGVALAFLSKGLVGILIPGTVAVCYLLARRDWSLIWRARPWWTLLALALIAAPWVVLVEQRNPGFAQFFFVHEQFARFLTRVHQRYQPDWFFVPVLLLGYMPWTPLLASIARRSWIDSRAGDGACLLLVIWTVFSFAFFSLSQSKLIPYILPLFPALSLLAGRTLALADPRPVQRAFWVAAALWVALGLSALWVWKSQALSARLDLPGGPVVPTIAASFLLVGFITAGASWLVRRRGVLPATALAAVGSLLLVTALLRTADQLPAQRHNRALVAAAAAHLGARHGLFLRGCLCAIPAFLSATHLHPGRLSRRARLWPCTGSGALDCGPRAVRCPLAQHARRIGGGSPAKATHDCSGWDCPCV